MDFLVIDDDKAFRDATCLLIDGEGHYAEAARSGELGLAELKEGKFDSVLLDLNLGPEKGLDILEQILKRQPNLPVIIFTAQGSVKNAVEAMRRGAVDFLEKPFTREQFHLVLARVQRFHQLNQNIERLELAVKESNAQSPEILLDSSMPLMKEVMDTLLRAAKTPASILILGESGTGKSVVARALHQQSHLAEKPFVTVSCPSLSRELLESELFGHVKGAFTGAAGARPGLLALADHGTIFLDELGDIPLPVQAKLLRVLEHNEVLPVGGNRPQSVSIRVVSATHQDLERSVAEGRFRHDLYFRLSAFPIHLPPLRERGDDVVLLAEHFLRTFAPESGPLGEETRRHLLGRPWLGNVRELRNAVEHAAIVAQGAPLRPEHFLPPVVSTGVAPADDEARLAEAVRAWVRGRLPVGGRPVPADLHAELLRRVEPVLLQEVLRRVQGNRVVAARWLGLARATVRKLIRKWDAESGACSGEPGA
jgi:two-component system, NtrC family, response regulator AlgB